MQTDIRLIIGLLFAIVGVLLCGFGALGPRNIYEPSLGINVNMWWGAALLVFGAGMLWLGRRGQQAGGK